VVSFLSVEGHVSYIVIVDNVKLLVNAKIGEIVMQGSEQRKLRIGNKRKDLVAIALCMCVNEP